MASMSTCITHSLIFPYSRPRTFPTLNPPLYPTDVVSSLPSLRTVWRATSVVRTTSALDVSAAIRPVGAVESDKIPGDVRRRAMDAVGVCGGRVMVGDVASRVGMKVGEAQKALQALAANTGGVLETRSRSRTEWNDYEIENETKTRGQSA